MNGKMMSQRLPWVVNHCRKKKGEVHKKDTFEYLMSEKKLYV